MPQISVIVPVYNVEQYLSRCLDSIINQTYRNFEVILVDDGSPDKCPEICDYYALQDNRIKVIHKENGGLADARNEGIRASSGEFITFIDSDDFVSFRYLEVLLDGITRHNADIIIAKFQRFESKNNIKNFVIIDDWVRKLTEIIENKNNRIVDIKSKDYDINSSCIKLQRLYCNSF